MSLILVPLRVVRASVPLALTAAGVVLVILFLFAYPLVSVALALAVPLLMVALVGGFAIWMNARTSMWHGRRPFYFGVADWGFLGCFAAFAAYGFANVEASAQMIAYVFVGVLFIAACRFAFMEFEAWWLGIAFAVVMLLITGEYLLFTLPHPEWFFDFAPSLALTTSLALIVAGSVASYRQARRVDASEEAPPWGKSATLLITGALMAMLVVSALATLTGRTTAMESSSRRIEWAAKGITDESNPPVEAGTYQVLLRNRDLTVHTFTWLRLEQVNCVVNHVGQELCETATYRTGNDFTLGPGSERLVTVVLDAGVDYELTCDVPGHNH